MRSVLRSVLHLLVVALTLLGSLLAGPAPARADGIIIIIPPGPPEPWPIPPDPWPGPGPRPPRRPRPPIPPRQTFFPLSVKTHFVTVDVAGPVATTEVDQVFQNPNPQDLEGTYIFPLPEGATVSKFSLYMNGKEVEAELLDADKARSIYEGIVRQMKDPALLEYAGRGIVKARLYPIPARGDARVKIAYSQVLRSDAGLTEVRYPLSTEKWSATPLQEASVSVRIRGAGEGGQAVGNVFSPSHPIEVVRTPARGGAEGSSGGVTARWSARNTLPDRDFVVYFQRADAGRVLDVSVITHRAVGEDGWFMMLLSPPSELGEGEPAPKDVVFVLDTSGSMSGEKIVQAKGALKYCINALEKGDRFAVVDFATEVRAWKQELVPASTEALGEALRYVEAMKARGGTDICGALTEALRYPGASGRPFLVVFLTDGEPTIGTTIPADIEKAVRAAREARPDAGDVRLFVLGIGGDLNAPLLDRLAEQGRGAREYVAEGESIELKVSRFFDKVAAPVLSDVRISIPGLDVYDHYPRPVPDLFRGGEVAVIGRFRGSAGAATSVRIQGKIGGKALEVIAPARFPDSASAPFLPRLHAVRKVGWLLDQVRLHGETEEVRREIVRLAKEHGIVTPYTSYLVVEDEKRISQARPGGARHAAADAIEGLMRGEGMRPLREEAEKAMDLARSGAKAGPSGSAGAATEPPAAPATGADKERQIAAGEAARGLQEATPASTTEANELRRSAEAIGRYQGLRKDGGAGKRAADDVAKAETDRQVQDVVKLVEGRTFYRRGAQWVDARCAPEAKVTRRVAYMSEAYWKLLAERPSLGKFLSIGAEVRLSDGGEVIEVTDEEEPG